MASAQQRGCALLIAGLLVAPLAATHPEVSAVYPRGARQGSEVTLQIYGQRLQSIQGLTFFKEGIADAVGLGQGELTFRDVVQAIDSGESLETVPGLMVERDGKTIMTDHRPVVGFDKFPDAPWHLIDFEEYVERQQNPGPWKMRHKYPDCFVQAY